VVEVRQGWVFFADFSEQNFWDFWSRTFIQSGHLCIADPTMSIYWRFCRTNCNNICQSTFAKGFANKIYMYQNGHQTSNVLD